MDKTSLGSFLNLNPQISLEKGKEYPFVEMADLEPGKRFVTSKSTKNYSGGGSKFQTDDILFARITPCLENGKTSQFIHDSLVNGFGSTEFYVLRGLPNVSITNYIYYLAQLPSLREAAEKSMYGASGRQRVNKDAFLNIEINKISISLQKYIVAILSKYDLLIENNTRRIKILEEMAQTIYTEWFVNFRFPGHENVKFVDSGLGKIPEGWEYKSITNIPYFRYINENISSYKGKKTYYATADIEGIDIVSEGVDYSFQDKPSRAQKKPIKNSVWFARMSNTYKVLLFTKINENIANNSMISSGFAGFEALQDTAPFLFTTINSKDFENKKNMYSTGATQISLNNQGLSRIKVVSPEIDTVQNFCTTVSPIIDNILQLQIINKNLAKQRDLLIPKLISGEIDVSELNIDVEEEND